MLDYNISLFISSYLIGIAFFYCFNQISTVKLKFFSIQKYSLIIGSVFTFVNLYTNAFIKSLVSFSFFTICIYYLYQNTFIKSLIKSTVWLLFLALADSLIGLTFMYIYNTSIDNIVMDSNIYFLYNVSLTLFVIIASFSMNQITISKSKLYKNNLFKNHQFFVIIFLVFMAFSMAFNSFLTMHVADNKLLLVINIGLMIIYLFIVITYLYTNKMWVSKSSELDQVSDEYNNLKLYTEIMENLMDELRVFKHDHNNLLYTLQGYAIDENTPMLIDILNTQLSESNQKHTTQIQSLSKIKDPGLKGILTIKINKMLENNINVDVFILDTIDHLSVDIVKFCQIIGIFLDNALESSIDSLEKNISISLMIQNQSLNIMIGNSFDKSSKINLNKIKEKGYSSKGENRGLGLYSVEKIMEDIPEISLDTTIAENLFIQDLNIILQ